MDFDKALSAPFIFSFVLVEKPPFGRVAQVNRAALSAYSRLISASILKFLSTSANVTPGPCQTRIFAMLRVFAEAHWTHLYCNLETKTRRTTIFFATKVYFC
jgi:hypothetical protein